MDDEFRTFYEVQLRPVLEELEARRRGIWRRLLSVAGIAALAAVVSVALFVRVFPPALFLAPVVGLGAIAVSAVVLFRGFVPEYKRRVVGAVARHIDPSLTYSPTGHITESQFRGSRIFRHNVDRYGGEDHVRGTVGKTAIEFSEVHAEYRTTHTDSKGRKHTEWHTIFSGLFVIADFNKDFRGQTVVLPDVAERALGWLGQKLRGLGAALGPGELVKLEDPEFEREFVVYADDQVEARYILSPALMERLTQFKRKTGKACYFSFVGSNVHVAVSTERNMFEPRIWSTLLDPALVEGYHRDLRFALGIVEDLNLNTRIWTKE